MRTQNEPGRKFWKVFAKLAVGSGLPVSPEAAPEVLGVHYKAFIEADSAADTLSRNHPGWEVFVACVTRVHYSQKTVHHTEQDLD